MRNCDVQRGRPIGGGLLYRLSGWCGARWWRSAYVLLCSHQCRLPGQLGRHGGSFGMHGQRELHGSRKPNLLLGHGFERQYFQSVSERLWKRLPALSVGLGVPNRQRLHAALRQRPDWLQRRLGPPLAKLFSPRASLQAVGSDSRYSESSPPGGFLLRKIRERFATS